MPIVRVSMWSGRAHVQKAEMAERITSTVMDVTRCERNEVTVIFEDVEKVNWATGGTLASGR